MATLENIILQSRKIALFWRDNPPWFFNGSPFIFLWLATDFAEEAEAKCTAATRFQKPGRRGFFAITNPENVIHLAKFEFVQFVKMLTMFKASTGQQLTVL